jgi:hypothetical protein
MPKVVEEADEAPHERKQTSLISDVAQLMMMVMQNESFLEASSLGGAAFLSTPSLNSLLDIFAAGWCF